MNGSIPGKEIIEVPRGVNSMYKRPVVGQRRENASDSPLEYREPRTVA